MYFSKNGDGRDAVMWVDGDKASATVRTTLTGPGL